MSLVRILRSSKKTSVLKRNLGPSKLASILYHDIFDYPLNSSELFKWKAGKLSKEFSRDEVRVESKLGYYFKKGRSNLVPKRLIREKVSKLKFQKARKVGNMLKYFPTVQMVAVTGALSMNNADEESDIDLMIVTKSGTLWMTRGVVWVLLKSLGISLRTPGDKNEKDKICLNIWLDEIDLAWIRKERNIFSAHEIAQVAPLVNKNETYEKFLFRNSWIKDYWPNAAEISSKEHVVSSKEHWCMKLISPMLHSACYILQLIEKVAFRLQYFYMKDKITRETITPTRALFHPVDWKKIVLSRLS